MQAYARSWKIKVLIILLTVFAIFVQSVKVLSPLLDRVIYDFEDCYRKDFLIDFDCLKKFGVDRGSFIP